MEIGKQCTLLNAFEDIGAHDNMLDFLVFESATIDKFVNKHMLWSLL